MADRIPRRREGPPKARQRRPPADPRQRELDLWIQRAPWRRCRLAYIKAHPLCELCREAGRIEPAQDVHHKVDRSERPDLAYDESNLQALCKPCHSRITLARLKQT